MNMSCTLIIAVCCLLAVSTAAPHPGCMNSCLSVLSKTGIAKYTDTLKALCYEECQNIHNDVEGKLIK